MSTVSQPLSVPGPGCFLNVTIILATIFCLLSFLLSKSIQSRQCEGRRLGALSSVKTSPSGDYSCSPKKVVNIACYPYQPAQATPLPPQVWPAVASPVSCSAPAAQVIRPTLVTALPLSSLPPLSCSWALNCLTSHPAPDKVSHQTHCRD